MIKIIIDTIVFPFRSLKHCIKSIFIVALVVYVIASLFVIMDYLRSEYGYYGKFICSLGIEDRLRSSVVRVVGSYSEGSGFFIAPNQVMTNFHVIAGEPSPKIIFPDGHFITPEKITGDKNADLAILYTTEQYQELVLPHTPTITFSEREPLLAVGYPLGTELSGKATIMKGVFSDFRKSKKAYVDYVQADISLVPGMSGGPLTDMCGNVFGINTMSLSGLSMFTSYHQALSMLPHFTDQEITKVSVDPDQSPEDAVYAFYTYLKTRRMKEGFSLLSSQYLLKTNYEEWTNRFKDVLDVIIIKVERDTTTDDTAFIKFSTKNWVDGETELHYYEGTWQTIHEDNVYKMLKSKIIEVDNPDYQWFYE